MVNAKALGSTHSAFHNMVGSKGMLLVLLLIVVGQALIVNFGGRIFRTVPLSGAEWMAIIAATSIVMGVGEIGRLWKRTR